MPAFTQTICLAILAACSVQGLTIQTHATSNQTNNTDVFWLQRFDGPKCDPTTEIDSGITTHHVPSNGTTLCLKPKDGRDFGSYLQRWVTPTQATDRCYVDTFKDGACKDRFTGHGSIGYMDDLYSCSNNFFHADDGAEDKERAGSIKVFCFATVEESKRHWDALNQEAKQKEADS